MGVSKSFPGIRALDRVDFTLASGEVHGLVGENGAGKSTLIKILTGAYLADSGRVEVFGAPMGAGPRAQARAGIAAIYQELTVVPEMTAVANVFLGQLLHRGPLLRQRDMERRFGELAQSLGVEIAPRARAGSLSVANQQMLEIMRALQAEHRILIMDEPTASLGPQERMRLHDTVRRLKQAGTSIIYISHDLAEVLALCEQISVMRDGRLVASKPVSGWTADALVAEMLGEALSELKRPHQAPSGKPLLRLEKVSVAGAVHDVSFTLGQGEILGIAGLVGAGRTELLRAIAGCQQSARGELEIDGKRRPLPGSPREAIRLGIALAPEDRKGQGLVLTQSGLVNMTLTDMGKVARFGWVRRGSQQEAAGAIARSLRFDPARLRHLSATLSGGNQQKLVVGKWLHRRPRVLLMDEPTRGIDVGAKAEMFEVIHRLAEEGMAVVLVSSEIEEVLDHSDRILVLSKGRVMAELTHEEASMERVLNLAFATERVA
jgi:ABC-type sugar transport system ATPase subunit